MKEGDRCPSCPGGTLHPALYVPRRGLSFPVLICHWCGYQCKDEGEIERPAAKDRDGQSKLGAV